MHQALHFRPRPRRPAIADTLLRRRGRVFRLLREWRRRRRSRFELAAYSHDQRNDFGFAAGLDAEIAKPFWRK